MAAEIAVAAALAALAGAASWIAAATVAAEFCCAPAWDERIGSGGAEISPTAAGDAIDGLSLGPLSLDGLAAATLPGVGSTLKSLASAGLALVESFPVGDVAPS